MDAREEGCFETTPCHWHHIPTTLHCVISGKVGLLSRPSYEPSCIAGIANDYSVITSNNRTIAKQ
jgi:hypothetical protein